MEFDFKTYSEDVVHKWYNTPEVKKDQPMRFAFNYKGKVYGPFLTLSNAFTNLIEISGDDKYKQYIPSYHWISYINIGSPYNKKVEELNKMNFKYRKNKELIVSKDKNKSKVETSQDVMITPFESFSIVKDKGLYQLMKVTVSADGTTNVVKVGEPNLFQIVIHNFQVQIGQQLMKLVS